MSDLLSIALIAIGGLFAVTAISGNYTAIPGLIGLKLPGVENANKWPGVPSSSSSSSSSSPGAGTNTIQPAPGGNVWSSLSGSDFISR